MTYNNSCPPGIHTLVWPTEYGRNHGLLPSKLGFKSVWLFSWAFSLLDHLLWGKPCQEQLLLYRGPMVRNWGLLPTTYTNELGSGSSRWAKPQVTAGPLTASLQFLENTWARAAQLSHAWIPDPQKWLDNKCLLFEDTVRVNFLCSHR